jgi:chromosomal replication initiator protein
VRLGPTYWIAMEITASELWSLILQAAQSRIPEPAFRAWLAGTRPGLLTEHELVVETPNPFHSEWLADKYGALLEAAAARALGRSLSISFITGDFPAPLSLPSVELTTGPFFAESPPVAPPRMDGPPPLGLNRRYTFEKFVVGGDNQLAAAACVAVAEKPARMYNPLFLYGGVGLGKTHLMHAIGNAILAADPRKRVAYIPSEQFMNELVTAIQEGTTPQFRRRYRQIDLLLVDDVHFLERKERTQEEFFHTFNALYDAHRQIVLTSDRPPKEIPGLEERLISRFEWGLVADIQAPDYETRVAILRKKASDDALALDPEVIELIARSCTSSVRELEGAVIKLLAYSSLKHQEITVELARTALQGVLGRGEYALPRRLTPEDVRNAVAIHWRVDAQGLVSPRRTKDLSLPRQIAMYLMREVLGLTLAQIGTHFGGRDHSTVIHSVRKVEEQMRVDSAFRREVEALKEELSRTA